MTTTELTPEQLEYLRECELAEQTYQYNHRDFDSKWPVPDPDIDWGTPVGPDPAEDGAA